MTNSDTTCWTMIEAAAKGSQPDRDLFAKNFLPVVRSYLTARWKSGALLAMCDDAVQDVFVECFRSGGPLARADRERAGGFRPFLFGVVRNIARRFEERQEQRQRKQHQQETALAHLFQELMPRHDGDFGHDSLPVSACCRPRG